MVDERARAEATQGRVVEVLRRGPATPTRVIQKVVESDDRAYSSDQVRGAINTLINRREVVIDGGHVRLSRS
jgi:hypothetical protein